MITDFHLIAGRQSIHLPLPGVQAICRSSFDNELALAAVQAGATFVPRSQATVRPDQAADWRYVDVRRDGEQTILRARVVVSADGLTRSSVRCLPEFAACVADRSRVGMGTILTDNGEAIAAGRITMVVISGGYIGLTRLTGQRLVAAAALDPELLRRIAVRDVVATALNSADIDISNVVRQAEWRGTPPLTSRASRVAAHRLFVIGDAAGYVEPFTGEGIATALESARAIGPLIKSACIGWKDSLVLRWEALHRTLVEERLVICRRLAWTLRHPTAVVVAATTCRLFPRAASGIVRRVSQLSPRQHPARICPP